MGNYGWREAREWKRVGYLTPALPETKCVANGRGGGIPVLCTRIERVWHISTYPTNCQLNEWIVFIIHRQDDPYWECNRCACAIFRDEWPSCCYYSSWKHSHMHWLATRHSECSMFSEVCIAAEAAIAFVHSRSSQLQIAPRQTRPLR